MKFYTLSEAAKEIGVPVHVLGYWLKKWQIEVTYRAGHVRLYDSKSLDVIKTKVATARTVGAFTSTKCPKEDCISLSQFYLATGIAKSSLIRAIKNLEKMNLIYKKVNDSTCVYRFVKDYSLWKPFTKKQIVYQKVKNRLLKSNPQKIITKEIYSPNSVELRTSELLLNLIRQRNVNFKQPDIQKWATHTDRMLRLDKRPVEEIEAIIRWCQVDPFWQSNILSTAKLREKYDQLYLKMTSNGQSATKQRYY